MRMMCCHLAISCYTIHSSRALCGLFLTHGQQMCCVITKNTRAVCSRVRHVMHSQMYTLILLAKKRVHLFINFFFLGGDVETEEIRFVRQFVGVADTEEFRVIRQIIGGGAPRMISSAALDMLIVVRCDSETEELLS